MALPSSSSSVRNSTLLLFIVQLIGTWNFRSTKYDADPHAQVRNWRRTIFRRRQMEGVEENAAVTEDNEEEEECEMPLISFLMAVVLLAVAAAVS